MTAPNVKTETFTGPNRDYEVTVVPKDKITKGPWSEPCHYGSTRFEVQGDGRRVAVVDRYEDAVLVHMAPDLLKALKKIANGEGVYGAQAYEYKEIAREVIAKLEEKDSIE